MDEVNVEPVDLRDEVRVVVEPRLDLAPVIIGCPMVGELPHRRQLHALRVVVDRFAVGPSRCDNPPLKVRQLLIGGFVLERPDRRGFARLWRDRSADERALGG